MENSKTIRVSETTYKELLAYKAELEIENAQRLSFDEAIDLLFSEVAGLEHELISERLKHKRSYRRGD